MEWVNHVDVVKVCRCCLVCDVHRVLQRKIPNRECLKLRIARSYAVLVLVIELAKTYSHLAAARARCGHDNQRTLGLYVVVLSEAVV